MSFNHFSRSLDNENARMTNLFKREMQKKPEIALRFSVYCFQIINRNFRHHNA
jgi:hypothetical protein